MDIDSCAPKRPKIEVKLKGCVHRLHLSEVMNCGLLEIPNLGSARIIISGPTVNRIVLAPYCKMYVVFRTWGSVASKHCPGATYVQFVGSLSATSRSFLALKPLFPLSHEVI
jgi:hypothetical protein